MEEERTLYVPFYLSLTMLGRDLVMGHASALTVGVPATSGQVLTWQDVDKIVACMVKY